MFRNYYGGRYIVECFDFDVCEQLKAVVRRTEKCRTTCIQPRKSTHFCPCIGLPHTRLPVCVETSQSNKNLSHGLSQHPPTHPPTLRQNYFYLGVRRWRRSYRWSHSARTQRLQSHKKLVRLVGRHRVLLVHHVGVPAVVAADPHGAMVEVHEHGVGPRRPQWKVNRSLGFVELRHGVQADARSLIMDRKIG